jgi:hypothetical protein
MQATRYHPTAIIHTAVSGVHCMCQCSGLPAAVRLQHRAALQRCLLLLQLLRQPPPAAPSQQARVAGASPHPLPLQHTRMQAFLRALLLHGRGQPVQCVTRRCSPAAVWETPPAVHVAMPAAQLWR